MRNVYRNTLLCLLIAAIFVMPISAIHHEVKNFELKSKKITNFPVSTNGVILDQELNEDGKGFTILRVWGTYYEMGYAQAELLGDSIVKAIAEVKEYIGNEYDQTRNVLKDAIWMPPEIEDTFQGMVDCLAVSHPRENIDDLDLKLLNTLPDWSYACRSHTCWGRYVSEPIKTLSTRRLDFQVPFSSGYHHVLCAYNPTDESPQWINFCFPGVIVTITGVNEFGTIVSLHDYQSTITDFSANRMARGVAARYAITRNRGPDVSTHLLTVYAELQDYEMMTGTFLNYYAPEGYGGVLTCNPSESGPDFYHLRLPQKSWHHGEAMITTNAWTNGTFTPNDEDFDADDFYNDDSPKTLEDHWNLLYSKAYGGINLQLLSVAFREQADMTIWADGKLSQFGDKTRTPRLEWEWTELFTAEPPTMPEITGSARGEKGEEYRYAFCSTDANNDEIYYWIDWGDDSEIFVTGPFKSGEKYSVSHSWLENGRYTIRAKGQDSSGLESGWATMEVAMPKTEALKALFQRFLERFPNLFPILQKSPLFLG